MCLYDVLLMVRDKNVCLWYQTPHDWALSIARVLIHLSIHEVLSTIFFLTFSGAVEGSVWNTVTKALSLPTVIGQTGLPGHRAPGPAEEGCPTETASALIPSKQVWISQLTSEHLSATSLSNSACTWAQSYSFCTSNFIVRKLSRKAFSLKQF